MTGDVPAPTVPDLDAIRGRYRAADFATDEPWAAALNDVVLSSWLDVPALLAEVERLRAQREAVLALHRSYYEVNGQRIEHTALIYCDDWTCTGADDNPCAEANNEGAHEIPACSECRWQNAEDCDFAAYPAWPCPTVRALGVDAP